MNGQTLNRSVESTTKTPPSQLTKTLLPLALDVAIPLGSYYVMRDVIGLSLVASLALSSIVPAARSVAEFIRARRFEALAILMVTVNVATIIVNLITHDTRLMLLRDSVTSSIIGIGILISVWRGQPIMNAALMPWVTKGKADRVSAYERLTTGSHEFRRLQRRYSVIWGVALLTECTARAVGAMTLPVTTMVWLSTAILIGAIVGGAIIGGGAAGDPMEKMIDTDIRTATTER
jgi:hypothetical protein